MDFEDDIALVSEGIKEAQEMRNTRITKTKYMSYNTNQQFEIKAIDKSI